MGQLVGVLWAVGAWTAQRSRVGRRRAGERRLAVVRLMCVGSVAVLATLASWRVTAFVVAVAADAIYICYSRLLVRTHKYYQVLKPRPVDACAVHACAMRRMQVLCMRRGC